MLSISLWCDGHVDMEQSTRVHSQGDKGFLAIKIYGETGRTNHQGFDVIVLSGFNKLTCEDMPLTILPSFFSDRCLHWNMFTLFIRNLWSLTSLGDLANPDVNIICKLFFWCKHITLSLQNQPLIVLDRGCNILSLTYCGTYQTVTSFFQLQQWWSSSRYIRCDGRESVILGYLDNYITAYLYRLYNLVYILYALIQI